MRVSRLDRYQNIERHCVNDSPSLLRSLGEAVKRSPQSL